MFRFIKPVLFWAVLLTSVSVLAQKKGGNFNFNLGAEPPTLHPITASDGYSSTVQAYLLDTLLTRDVKDFSWKPHLAEKWEVSKDGKVFTFYLRKGVVFHDGKPLTAEDVKFSFDAIFEPAYQAVNRIPYYEGIEKVEIVDSHTVKIYAKDTYFQNFEIAAGLEVIPKHVYGDVEKSKKMNKDVVGSGPYMISKYDKGNRLILKRFDKWFGNSLPEFKDQYNFETITMRFVKEENVVLEMLKKGDLDFYSDMTADQYVLKTKEDPWGRTVKAHQVENLVPKTAGFIGFNLTNNLFKDKDVRRALAHLLNREEIAKKFLFDKVVPAGGPVYYKSEYSSPKQKPIPFDAKTAGALLVKAGWKDTDKNGVLDKVINGQKTEFRFSVLYASKVWDPWLTLYKEDLKKAGIDLELKLLEWNAFTKALDDKKFETIAMSWRPAFEWDPKQIWHSTSSATGGSNFISYNNPKVDKLIEVARMEIDRPKRVKMLREVADMIAEDVPYIFMFNRKYDFYAANVRILRPVDTYKYGVGLDYWSIAP